MGKESDYLANKKRIYLFLCSLAAIALVLAGSVYSVLPNPGHPAYEIGGNSDAERTFNGTLAENFTFPSNLLVSGKIGIGTANPSAKLEVNDSNFTFYAGGQWQQIYVAGNTSSALVYIDRQDNNGPPLRVDTGGANHISGALFVQNNSYVGVGTVSPSYKLDVSGDIRSISGIHVTNNSKGDSYLGYFSGNGGFLWLENETSSANVLIRSYGDTYFNSGFVGIGITTPSAKLDVRGNVSLNNSLYVISSGFVGINSSSPTHNLHVKGNANITGTLYAGAIVAGSTSYGGDIDMQNNIITNIGNAGTDFNTNGGLTLASKLTITAGGLNVTSGGINNSNGGISNSGNIGLGTGTTISAGGNIILDANGAGTVSTEASDNLLVGGGYGSTGLTLYSNGNLSMDGNFVSQGTGYFANALTVNSGGVTITTGGLTVSAGGASITGGLNNNNGGITNAGSIAGATTIDGSGDLTVGTITMTGFSVDASGNLDSLSEDIGGGYGSSGASVDSSGNINMNGNLVTDGQATFGGGYGSTGLTLYSNGNLSMNGNLIVDGTSYFGSTMYIGNPDTNLYRGAANRLQTDDSFYVGSDLYVIGNLYLQGILTNYNVATLNVNGSLIPSLTGLFDVGSSSKQWRHGNFSGNVFAASVTATTFTGTLSGSADMVDGHHMTATTDNRVIKHNGVNLLEAGILDTSDTVALILDSNENVNITADITIGGNDIKDSAGTTRITIGSNVIITIG